MEVIDLKACREERGLSLDDVYGITKISAVLLRAIEESDFASLPPPVYTRKFITAYAEYLGQPSDPILAKYEKHLETVPPSSFHPVHAPVNNLGKGRFPGPQRTGRRINRSLLVGLIAVIILALIIPDLRNALVQGVINLKASIISTPDMEPAENNRPEVQINRPVAGQGKAALDAAADDRQHLIIEARELTWLRIRTDNDPPHQLLMRPGERIERFADRNFAIDIGNAGGVELHLQGRSLGQLGKSGEVVRLRLP